jgi:two-component system nitrate/nitrite sensor histidine kinase NarX
MEAHLPERDPSAVVPAQAILAEITAGLSTGRDLQDLLQGFLEPVVRLAGACGGAVRVLSDDNASLCRVSQIGLSAQLCHAPESAGRDCGACGAAAVAAGPVWADDLGACLSRHRVDPAAPDTRHRLLAVPLQHRGRVLGVYSLFFGEREAPPPEVLALLKSVGELLGLALNNARLEAENLRARLMHERQRMAADVHDTLAQSLAYVKMRLPLLHDAMLAHDDEHALQYYGDVRGEVSRVHASLRAILTHLRQPMDPQGLVHALNDSVDSFRRSSGARLDYINELPGLRLGTEQETQVFHIVQEALTNILRHAGAGQAWLKITGGAADSVEILIEDDGAGLPPAAARSGHYGLEIMQERARGIGAALEVGGRPGGGTRVRLSFAASPAGAH